MANIAIVGAGFMGSAMAWPLSDNGHEVRLVGTHLDQDIIKSCVENGFHPKLKRKLPARVQPHYLEDLARALADVDVIVSGVSSPGVHWIGRTLAPHVKPGQKILAITKGLEAAADGQLRILPDVLADELPAAVRDQLTLAAVGGPCIAGELAARRPGRDQQDWAFSVQLVTRKHRVTIQRAAERRADRHARPGDTILGQAHVDHVTASFLTRHEEMAERAAEP